MYLAKTTPMNFHVGDHVLWWGEKARVCPSPRHPDELYVLCLSGRRLGDMLRVDADTLAVHQMPWRYDEAFDGWLPAKPPKAMLEA